MDHHLDAGPDRLYGAVTVGDVWRFGAVDRSERLVRKDIDAFLVPGDLEDLFAVLAGIVQNESWLL